MGFSERLEFIIDAVGTGAIRTFKNVGDAADTHLSAGSTASGKLAGSLDDLAARSPIVGKAFAKLGTDGTQLASTIGTALPGAALAGAAGIGALAATSVAKFQDLAGSVLDFQRVAGTSAEESSAFVAVLDDYAISAEAGGKAIFKMADIAGSTPEEFAKYGVSIAKNADGTTNLEETLLNAAEAYQNTGDDATKAALLMDLFGRRGADLIPILEKGKDGADGLAAAFAGVEGQQILSQGQLDQAEDTRLALDRLNDAVGEFTLALGSGLSPVVETLADQLSTLSETADSVLGPVGGLDSAIGFMTNSALKGGPILSTLIDGIGGLAFASDQAKIAMEDAAGIAGGDWTKGMNTATAATDAATQALSFGLTPAHVINATATLNKAAADREAKDAADQFTSSLAAQKAAADALFASTNSLISSDIAYRNSVDSTEDSVNAMREAHNAAAAAGLQDAAANEALDDATRGAESAILAESQAAVAAAEDQAALANHTLSAAEKADIQRDALEGLKNKFPELNDQIQAMIDKLNAIPSNVSTTVTTFYENVGDTPTRPVGAARSALTVGGRGEAAGVSGRQAPVFNLTVNAGIGANGAQIGNQIIDAIKQWERSNGTAWRN